MKRLYFLTALIGLVFFTACQEDKKTDLVALDKFSKGQQVQWLNKLSSVVISDIFSAPVCSRIYAYTNIAAYEALRPIAPQQISYSNKLNGLGQVPQPEVGQAYYFPISSIVAFTTVGKKMVFNADTLAGMEQAFLKELDGLPLSKTMKENSIAYGQKVGQYILEWAAKDGYLQRNSIASYIVTKDIARWKPTPPDYMDAVETNWRTLRPFSMDSAAQFRPIAPIKFDSAKNSAFYKEAFEAFETVNKLTEEQKAIAWFWDCNPNTSVTQGHDAIYENYRLEVQYRFAAKPGNCGVLVFASTPRALYKEFSKSIEVQMEHQNAGDFWCIVEDITVPDMEKRRGPKEKWGITEDKERRIINLADGSEKPVGEWNTMVIECFGNAVKVCVNGVLVNYGTNATVSKGQIALQAEESEVELSPISALSN